MKLATWNVNSLTVRLPQLLDWLGQQQPDVLVLQETKLTDDKFPQADISAAGWHSVWFGQKTYNGVALLARSAPQDVVHNIPGFDDPQARVIAATVDGVRVVGAYFPNGQAPDSDKFVYKMAWLQALQDWLRSELAQHPQLVLMGDFNIAPDDRDVFDPVAWAGQIHCTPEERGHFQALCGLGLVDAFRLFEQAAAHLELVGLPQPGLSQEPGSAHRPHPGQPGAATAGHRLQRRQAAAQERTPQRPRPGAGHTDRLTANATAATAAAAAA